MDEIDGKVFYDMVIKVRVHRDLSDKIEINKIFIGIGVMGYVNTMYKKVVGCDKEKTCLV